jgi:hypothetical protein
VTALDSHIKTLQAENEALKEQFAAAEARADKQAADFAARDAERVADLVAERARAEKQAADLGTDLAAERARSEKAIAAFASLADRLDALAAERARPWWRRFAG